MSNPMRINSAIFNRACRYVLLRRTIATTPNNRDNVTAPAVPAVKDICPPVEKPSGRKNWISYGFETKDYEDDRRATHSIMFASVTVCLILGGYYLTYLPDFNLRDWAQREAYLELRRRELAGLPLISPNLIDPAKIQLPSDEELGDTEIII